MALILSVEWFSLTRLPSRAFTIVDLTLAQMVAILLVPIVVLGVVRAPRDLLRPAPILVFSLATWVILANLRRPTFGPDSLRDALYFAASSSVAFTAAYLPARRSARTYGRALLALIMAMLIIGVGGALIERVSTEQTAGGAVVERIHLPWEFFRPAREFDNPVLGPVQGVVVTHQYSTGGSIQPASLFVKSNVYADFIAVASPVFLLTVILAWPKWSARKRMIAVMVFAAAVVTLLWTFSRAAISAALFAYLMIVAAVMHRRARTAPLLPVMFVVLSVPLAVGIASLFGKGLGLDGLAVALTVDVPTALASGQAAGGAYASNVSHILLQRVGLDMILLEPSTALWGVGRLHYLSAIFDPRSTYYLSWILDPGIGGPHSAYVSLAVVAGIPALFLYCSLLATSVGRGILAMFRGRTRQGDTVVLQAIASGVLGLVVVGFVDTNPILFPEAAFLFSVLGAVSGLGEKSLRGPASAGARERSS
jgi:hypothetical protein